MKELETRIAEAETRKAELEKRMQDNPSDYVLIQELDAEIQGLKVTLDTIWNDGQSWRKRFSD